MTTVLTDNSKISGTVSGWASDFLQATDSILDLYNGGKKAYESIPFTGDAQNLIEQNSLPTVAVTQAPAVTQKQIQKATEGQSFFDENKTLIIGGSVGLIALVAIIAVSR